MKFLNIFSRIKLKFGNSYYLFAFLVLTTSGCFQNQIRAACVGESITYGTFLRNRGVNSYPSQLGSMLGEGYEVKNFGRRGATLLSKGDLPYRDTEEYKQSLAFNPDVVFIKLGTNDAKGQNNINLEDEFITDYKDLIESYRSLPAAPRIILLVPVPVFTKDTIGIVSSVVTENIMPMVRQLAYETDCEIINLYNLFIESPEFFPDKIHPNAEGAQVIAQRLEEFIVMDADPAFDLREDLAAESDKFNFYGFQGFDFTFQGRNAKVGADKVVPVIENTMPFKERIKAADGSIKVIHKPGIDHHPHSLPNPQAIVNFIMEATK